MNLEDLEHYFTQADKPEKPKLRHMRYQNSENSQEEMIWK